MRIAVLGPTHPYRGGVAAHTTRTAQALAEAGHDVDLVSWSRLLPEALHPGEEALPGGEPEAEYARTSRPLHWNSPLSWWRTGRTLRDLDLEGPWLRYVQALTTGSPGAGAAEPAALDGVGSPG